MIKFLIYLFLFYVAARLIFGKVLGGNTVRTKVFRFDTHHHHYNSKDPSQNEGSITVDKNIKTKKGNDKSLGEYVDYEEVN